MTLTGEELSIVVAALRVAAVVYEKKAQEAQGAGSHREVRDYSAFAIECARLAAVMELEAPKRPTLIIPN